MNHANDLLKTFIKTICVQPRAMDRVVPYLKERSYRSIALIADENTYAVAGKRLKEQCSNAGLKSHICLIQPNAIGDVVADEASLIQCFVELPADVQVLLAIGSGTIHDIVRFVGSRMNKPFISVPTAASVDGFTSAGAPLIIRGFKQTVQAIPPEAIFADTDILINAPKRMTAAGFGDMLGKYTSLFDWRFSHLMAGEPYDDRLAGKTAAALQACTDNLEAISRGDRQGIEILMRSLIQSGLVMLQFGMSHPASGAEHHLSHYWEMEHLKHGKPQQLHGLKVGFATVQISKLYHRFANRFDPLLPADQCFVRNGEQRLRLLKHWVQIKKLIDEIPEPEALLDSLNIIGGAPDQLPIDEGAVGRGLQEAHTVRSRYTLLRFLNECTV